MAATDTDDVVAVYRTTDSLDAHALAAQMEDEGIEARVVGDFLTGGYGGLNFGKWGEIEVWVREADREAADRIAATWDGKDSPTAQAATAPKIRFSMKAVFVVMSLVAVFAATQSVSEAKSQAIIALAYLMAYVAFFYVAMKRRRRVADGAERISAATPLD